LSAIFLTIVFVRRGEASEPSGEYAVRTIPLSLQKSTSSFCGQALRCQLNRVSSGVRLIHIRVEFDLVNGGDYLGGVGQEASEELDREV